MSLTRPQIKMLRAARAKPIPLGRNGQPPSDEFGLPIKRPATVTAVINSLIKKKYLHAITGEITNAGRVALLVDPQASSDLPEDQE